MVRIIIIKKYKFFIYFWIMASEYFDIHLNNENILISESNIIKIVKENIYTMTFSQVISNFIVKYQGKNIFRFSMNTNLNGVTEIIKDYYKIIVRNKNTILKFIEDCVNYSKRILEEYEIIKNNFYLKNKMFMDEMFLKKKYRDKVSSSFVRIMLTFDGKYRLFVNFDKEIIYERLDDLINSEYLIQLRRNGFYNFLRKVKLF